MSFSLSSSWFELSEITATRHTNEVLCSYYLLLNGRRVAILTDSLSRNRSTSQVRCLTLYSFATNSIMSLWPSDSLMTWNQALQVIAETDPDVILGKQASVKKALKSGKKIRLETHFGMTLWVSGFDGKTAMVSLSALDGIWLKNEDVKIIIAGLVCENGASIEPLFVGDTFSLCEISNRRNQVERSFHIEKD
jgi:hypothetical protein